MLTQKPIFLEDSIMRKGLPATAGSKILQGFRAPFDAAVSQRLREAGYALESAPPAIEFGGRPTAAAAAVAEGRSDLALFSAFSGISAVKGLYSIRPTYGTVSRYGLIPSVSSMETIGIVCKDLAQGFALLSVIAGHDSRDGVSEPEPSYRYEPLRGGPKATAPDCAELPLLPVLPEVMAVLTNAERANNISRYDGIKFGYRAPGAGGLNDVYLKTRTEGFSLETKLSLVIGAMVLSEGFYEKRYHKAMQIRRMLRDQADALLSKYGVLSGTPFAAPLCGLPAVTLPDGTCLMAARKNENALYGAAERGL